MIIYLNKIKDNNFFEIETYVNLDLLLNTHGFNKSNINGLNSIFYEGDEVDINDLINIISRLFKKNKALVNGVDVFDSNIETKVIEFIDSEIEKGNFEISEKKYIGDHIIEPKTYINDEFLYCLLDLNNNLEIGTTNNFDTSVYADNFDTEKSFILKFNNSEDTSNFFNAIKLDTNKFHIPNDISILVTKKWSIQTLKLIRFKINLLKDSTTTFISLNSSKIVRFDNDNKFLSSVDVCNILSVSRQKLSYWRKTNLIKYKKMSDRKYVYSSAHVYRILDQILLEKNMKPQIQQKVIIPQQHSPIKKLSKLDKLKESFSIELPTNIVDHEIIEDSINYFDKIKAWTDLYTYKIPPHKFGTQHFFLNFGNVGFTSSPQVMINDDLQLVDYIKGTVIKETPEDLLLYLEELTIDGKEPRIDTSKKIYPGYSKFYLRKLD